MTNIEYELKKDIIDIIISTIEYIKNELEGKTIIDEDYYKEDKTEKEILYEKLQNLDKHKYKMSNTIGMLIHSYLYKNYHFYSCLKRHQKLTYLIFITKYIDHILVSFEEFNINNSLSKKINIFLYKIVILSTDKTFHRISLFTKIFSDYISKIIINDICKQDFIEYMKKTYNFDEEEIVKLLVLYTDVKGGKKYIKRRKYKFKKINKNKYKYIYKLIKNTKNIKRGGNDISCPLLKERDQDKLKLNIDFLNTLEEYVGVLFILFDTTEIKYEKFTYDLNDELDLHQYVLIMLNKYFENIKLYNVIPDNLKLDLIKIIIYNLQKENIKIVKFIKKYYYELIYNRKDRIQNILNKYFVNKILTEKTIKNIIRNSQIVIIEELEKLCINNDIKINPNIVKDFFIPRSDQEKSKSHRSY